MGKTPLLLSIHPKVSFRCQGHRQPHPPLGLYYFSSSSAHWNTPPARFKTTTSNLNRTDEIYFFVKIHMQFNDYFNVQILVIIAHFRKILEFYKKYMNWITILKSQWCIWLSMAPKRWRSWMFLEERESFHLLGFVINRNNPCQFMTFFFKIFFCYKTKSRSAGNHENVCFTHSTSQ